MSFFLGGLAVLFGIIGVTRKMRPKGLSTAGLILDVVSIVVAAIVTATTAAVVSGLDEEMNKATAIVYEATSDREASAMYAATDGTSNDTFTGDWEKESTVTGWDAASLIVTSEDYSK